MDNKQVEDIRDRLKSNAYFNNPHSDVKVTEDMQKLLTLLDSQTEKINQLEKKNKVLSDHVSELNMAIENVKSDFGDQR